MIQARQSRKSTLARGSRWYVTANGVRNGLELETLEENPSGNNYRGTLSLEFNDLSPNLLEGCLFSSTQYIYRDTPTSPSARRRYIK